MFNLIPREVRFFDYFEQQSQNIIRAAVLLHEMVNNFGDARAKAHAIKEVEHQGDQVTHHILPPPTPLLAALWAAARGGVPRPPPLPLRKP